MLITWTTGSPIITGLEVAALLIAFTVATAWGAFHMRRLWVLRRDVFRDALLASVLLFLLFRGGLELLRADGKAEIFSQASVSILFAPLLAGAVSLIVFPLLINFNFTLIALTGMISKKDTAAERSILPLYWPILFFCVIVDFALFKVTKPSNVVLWPVLGATLASPWLTLLCVFALRRREQDAKGLFWQLTMLLQRKCTHRQGRGLKDTRGLVLGVLAGLLTLSLATPLLHVFIAPYESAAYGAATRMGTNVLGARKLLVDDEKGAGLSFSGLGGAVNIMGEDPLSSKTQETLQKIIVITYDDSARRLVQEKSEAHVQSELLRQLAPTHPTAVALALPPEQVAAMLMQDGTTPSVSNEAILGNKRDYPKLAAAVKALGCVYIASSVEKKEKRSASAQAVLDAAKAVGSSQIIAYGTMDAPALPLQQNEKEKEKLTPISLLLAKPAKSIVENKDRLLIDYRLNLQEVRSPLSVTQVLQGQKLYDSTTRSWQTPAKLFSGKLVFIEALTPRLHETPEGPRGELEIQAQATAALLQGSRFETVPFWDTVLLVVGLAALVGHLCVGRAPLESLWRVAFPIVLVGGGCFLQTAFGALRVDPVLPVFGGILAFLMVTQFTFAVERDERARNRGLLARFIPPQAIEELLDDPVGKLGLGGKRRRLVVLFADVRGFSRFAEKSTPEEVVTTMNRYLMVMTDALNDHEGILDKYTGDGLMALFLVDENAVEADVLRAVRAAEAMAKSVLDLSQAMQAEGGEALAVGLGLHYGEAVVGLMGHPTRQVNYTALGHTVVVAARLQTLAAGGDIILSDAVYRALPPGTVNAEAGETVTVKGVADPVPIFRIRVTQNR
ncbi:adenylate/guanylate cyclase domain-containing protein [Armatimonas sp.]|uniref:adenylate/guanylate cyclase domain-containing protein n=1 Tax=Armatimonas sp. TaxID=1872638 RepID=UPI00286BE02B|nr:adenylate/guanylate cyclase domain-containing protein [Armatimonas sp.]